MYMNGYNNSVFAIIFICKNGPCKAVCIRLKIFTCKNAFKSIYMYYNHNGDSLQYITSITN